MTEASAPSSLQADVAIVGGGPCGLALAKGLLDLQYSVYVVEKEDGAKSTNDWSKAYSYRVESRGAALMERIGAMEKLRANAVTHTGFSMTLWKPDGSFDKKHKRTAGSTGYWLQRPRIIKVLKDLVPDAILVEGEVNEIAFAESTNTAMLHLNSGQTIQAKYLFGCDGIKSIVQQTLCQMDDAFQIHKVPSPSAGLVFRATLIKPPEQIDPEDACTIVGVNGNTGPIRVTLLPFNGQKGELRPMGCARHANDPMFQSKTPEEFYTFMETSFPQMQPRKTIPIESAEAWCTTEGSTFPVPRWAGKALMSTTSGVLVGILGDALHSFPPDLGLGVNSGLLDVHHVLDFMQQEKANLPTETSPKSRVDALNKALVEEARAICKMIPIGFPYQYTLPHSLHKVFFYIDFCTRLCAHKCFQYISERTAGLVINPFFPPVVLEMQDNPPLPFTTILQHHHHNTLVLWSTAAMLGATAAGWAFQWNRAKV